MSEDNAKKNRSILPRRKEQGEDALLDNLEQINRFRGIIGVFIKKDGDIRPAEDVLIEERKQQLNKLRKITPKRRKGAWRVNGVDDFIVYACKASEQVIEDFVIREISDVIIEYAKDRAEIESIFIAEVARRKEKEARKGFIGRSLKIKYKIEKEEINLQDYDIAYFMGATTLRKLTGNSK